MRYRKRIPGLAADRLPVNHRMFFWEEHNRLRHESGLHLLTWDEDAATVALERAVQSSMGSGALDHDDDSGRLYVSILWGWHGYRQYTWLGENLARWRTSPEHTMNLWKQSFSHRANILAPEFTSMGVGDYERDGTHWTAVVFVG